MPGFTRPSTAAVANNAKTLQSALADKAELYQALAAHFSGFRVRPGQQQLSDAVTEGLFSRQLIACEAGTGVGKTMGYLLGAAPFLLDGSKRLLISTNTIALQNQLIQKDLPLFAAAVMPSIKIALAKSGKHYLCPHRVLSLLNRARKGDEVDQTELDLDTQGQKARHPQRPKIDPNLLIQVEEIWHQFDEGTFDGDLDTLGLGGEHQVNPFLSRIDNQCAGKQRCEQGDRCPFYEARDKLKRANVIVANHAFVTTCLLNDVTLFGDLDSLMVVIDEAHHFHDVLRNAMCNRFELDQIQEKLNVIANLLKDHRTLQNKGKLDYYDKQTLEAAYPALTLLEQAGQRLDHDMGQLGTFLSQNFAVLRGELRDRYDNPDQWLLGFEANEPVLARLFEQAMQASQTVLNRLTGYESRVQQLLNRLAEQLQSTNKKRSVEMLNSCEDLAIDITNIQKTLARFVEHDQYHCRADRIAAGHVRWITRTNNGTSIELASNPLYVANTFEQQLVSQVAGVVMVSATLSALGDMSFFAERLGISSQRGHRLLRVQSSFDYSKVSISAPFYNGDPNHASHSSKVAAYLCDHTLQRHRAVLLLFSSQRQLEEVYQALPHAVRQRVLCQRQLSKDALIKQHCQRIETGAISILFGLDGLAEGVDLTGHYLTCVIISKLPFSALNEPLLQHEQNVIEANGRNSFSELMLPLCSQKLIQSCGRLIRSEEDYGEIVLLDSRVNTKQYARRLLKALPMYKQ